MTIRPPDHDGDQGHNHADRPTKELHATISALRDALEAERDRHSREIAAIKAYHVANEMQLREICDEARQELDRQVAGSAALQTAAERDYRDRIAELEATIASLREKLEELSNG
jgi:chromosome segregation ATPase